MDTETEEEGDDEKEGKRYSHEPLGVLTVHCPSPILHLDTHRRRLSNPRNIVRRLFIHLLYPVDSRGKRTVEGGDETYHRGERSDGPCLVHR